MKEVDNLDKLDDPVEQEPAVPIRFTPENNIVVTDVSTGDQLVFELKRIHKVLLSIEKTLDKLAKKK